MQDIKGIVIFAVVIATICLVIAFVGAVVITYWPIILAAAAATIGGIIYMKRQKRARNMV